MAIWVDCDICAGAGLWLVNGHVMLCRACNGTGKVRRIV